MRVGIPKEIKTQEFRVGLTPSGVREVCSAGHEVLVQCGAGLGIGIDDEAYTTAGATVVSSAEEVYHDSEILVKVKEPQPHECRMLRENQILFAYLHLAADLQQANLLKESGSICVAYETVMGMTGGLPLLAPMSEVAGRLSIQAAAHCLEKAHGGAGVLLGGVAGVAPANVFVIGGGVVGLNAARMAMGLGANVVIADKSLDRLKYIDEVFQARIKTLYATQDIIEQQLKLADAVIGAVLIPGAAAPKLVLKEHLASMKSGSVMVDVAIDQGGCFSTSKVTSHDAPTYTVDGVTHYCVANMPGAVARTSTWALTNATLPYVLDLANKGTSALKENPLFMSGLNIANGHVTHAAVAEALNDDYFSPQGELG